MVALTDEVYEEYEDFVNDLGNVEFDVRMTTEEKLQLLLSISVVLLGSLKSKESEGADTSKKEIKII